jgi:hypothetical protein
VTSLSLPRAVPWPKPTRLEQWGEICCYTYLGGTRLDGYALDFAKQTLNSWANPGSANQNLLKRVTRYGAAIRLDKTKVVDAAAACYHIFETQSNPQSGFMCIDKRNEAMMGHLGLWMLGIGAAWVLATQEDKESGWQDEIAKAAEKWFRKLYGALDLLSYKGTTFHLGWRDTSDLDAENDATLNWFGTGKFKPKYTPKQWNVNLNDAGCSILYQLWTLRVLEDLKLLIPGETYKPFSPDPTGIPFITGSSAQFTYLCEVEKIVPRKDWMRWSYRVDRDGEIWMQKQLNPTTKTRPSESECPFVKIGEVKP